MIAKTKTCLKAWTTTALHRTPKIAFGLIFGVVFAVSVALAAETPAGSSQADPAQVAGRWLRADGGYILELSHPTFDGRLTAAYFNPRPINVSRSEWVLKDGNLLIMVELRDKGYPGSTYALVYRQDTDRLVGIYFQAAVQQQFEVVFQRVE